MALTPSSADPNYSKEKRRKKKDPDSFGTDIKPQKAKEIDRTLTDSAQTTGR
jgi:hypothetical protein